MLHKFLQLTSGMLSSGKLTILMYHQVVQQRDPMRPTEPDAATFDWQMRLIRRYFTPLSLSEALERLQDNRLPNNAICVTFDDGYLNNLTVAAPILARHKVPATVYIATAFSQGENMWNDRLQDLCADQKRTILQTGQSQLQLTDWASRIHAAQQLINQLKYLPVRTRLQQVDNLYQLNGASEYPSRMMSTTQIKELAAQGITIGAHTHNHPILKSLTPSEQQQEISRCKSGLEQLLQCPVVHFAYPNGVEGRDFDDETMHLVAAAGFQSAVVTNRGFSTADSNLYKLKRFAPWDGSPLKFHLHLLKNYLS
ncbi:polysaccharide deacetylase family protein [Rheinheimera sp.]|uniref:polysaccharide deacetylase family protein n=1 Tax=Rheinheimera sp. TaxID=1869214 RepID=UPI002FDEC24F